MERLIYHPAAMDEVREAAQYYESARPGLGKRFLHAVDVTADYLQQRPLLWRQIDGPWRRMIIHNFPYAMIYRVDDQQIFVAAVMHMHRKPGYWKQRL